MLYNPPHISPVLHKYARPAVCSSYTFELAKGAQYRAEIIDPWEMTITPVDGTFEGKSTTKLPGKPYLAVRFRKVRAQE